MKQTSTLVVPLLARTIADAPVLLPTPTSPTIISVLSPLGPVKDDNVNDGIVGAPVPEDSNTACTSTTSATSRDTSLSCTRLPYASLNVRPSAIEVLTPEYDLSEPVTTSDLPLTIFFCFDFALDFCCVV